MYNYYKNELERLKHSDYFKSIKLYDNLGESTKIIDLNLESIPILIEYLNSEFNGLIKLKQLNESEEND